MLEDIKNILAAIVIAIFVVILFLVTAKFFAILILGIGAYIVYKMHFDESKE